MPRGTPAIAIAAARPRPFAYSAVVAVLLLLTVSCETNSATGSDGTTIEISPGSLSMVVGAARPLTARVLDASGNPVADARVFWSSEHPAIAVVTPEGIVTGVAQGNTQIAASINGTSAVVPVAVSRLPVSLVRINPTSANVQVGAKVSLSAEALDAAGGVVPGLLATWKSTNAAIASVSAGGVVTGIAPGSATLTATVAGLNGVAAVTVRPTPVASVTVSPSQTTLSTGKTVQLSATLRDAGGQTLSGRTIMWKSSSSNIATVSSTGQVTGRSKGTVTITATSEGKSGSATITVR